MPCVNYLSQGECMLDTSNNCLWTDNNNCEQDMCVYTTEVDCREDTFCDWQPSNQTCTVRPCVEHANDKLCDADLRCHWDTSSSPGGCQLERCARYPSQNMCEADAGCLWEKEVCLEKTCHKLQERCACQQEIGRASCRERV
eukprot:TRINITY_DN38791_c0_g1_i1.p1 TRINITY_DN38791_c0_g1~~TRINITY_DN38791_c0_g1_i1.p1  ORF type:complete len:142 (+),score=16.03 TRINITY_DN38791_c0_g1_i1:2-427(+)